MAAARGRKRRRLGFWSGGSAGCLLYRGKGSDVGGMVEWRRRHGSEGDSDVDRSVLEEAGEEVSGPVGRSGKGSGLGREKREGFGLFLFFFFLCIFFPKDFSEKKRIRKDKKVKTIILRFRNVQGDMMHDVMLMQK